jgi:glucose-1-phosphate cytidylyltransferase
MIDTAVILAGGKGTRISEYTKEIPKPMIPVGGKPILHHIMDTYFEQGVTKFVIPTGYLHSQILYYVYVNARHILRQNSDELKVVWADGREITCTYTGIETQTGGRFRELERFCRLPEKFFFTYGDGLSNVNLELVENMHESFGSLITLTCVHPVPRFGSVHFDDSGYYIQEFGEKRDHLDAWINGGWGVMERSVVTRYITEPEQNLERDILPILASRGKLAGYKHEGFWHCIDTVRDLEEAEHHWQTKGAWK